MERLVASWPHGPGTQKRQELKLAVGSLHVGAPETGDGVTSPREGRYNEQERGPGSAVREDRRGWEGGRLRGADCRCRQAGTSWKCVVSTKSSFDQLLWQL